MKCTQPTRRASTQGRKKHVEGRRGVGHVSTTGTRNDVYKTYMRNVSSVPLMSYSETINKFRLLRSTTDDQVRRSTMNELVRANLRLVVKIAHAYKRYAGASVNLDDLIQEGNIGLCEGIKRFDPERGYKPSTYISHWIKQAIRRQLGGTEQIAGIHIVRLPSHIIALAPKLQQARARLADKLGEEPSVEQLAAELNVTCDTIVALQDASGATLSIEQSSDQGDDRSLSAARLEQFMHTSMHAQHDGLTPDDQIFRAELHDIIRRGLSTLTPREERVIRLRFCIDEDPNSPSFAMTPSELDALNVRAGGSR